MGEGWVALRKSKFIPSRGTRGRGAGWNSHALRASRASAGWSAGSSAQGGALLCAMPSVGEVMKVREASER